MSVRLSDPRPEAAELQTEGPTPSRVWGDQWLRVSEKVIKGLNHQLTNRVASLEAVVTLLGDEEEVPDLQLMGSLAQEVKRLNQLLHLYRLMPAEPFVTTEPVRLQDAVTQVMELHGHHADLRGIPIEVDRAADTPPVLVRPSALLRCLLVLLESAAGNALRAGATGTLHVAYGGDADTVWVTFEAPCPPAQLLFTGDGSLVGAVNSALAHVHGHADVQLLRDGSTERIRYTVQLPTLAAARRAGL
ncbi:MAG: HAMP domain-containing histidine kinase [Gemmatimonadetes bacterium]|nr:HAMP domain-containing histidine kinase [Gemmatimonadota bacterium]